MDEDNFITHVKCFNSGRYVNYVLRVRYHSYYLPRFSWTNLEWWKLGSDLSYPPQDIVDAVKLWADNDIYANMSPVEFVHRMFSEDSLDITTDNEKTTKKV